jgi:hypothetical protein
MFLLSLHSTGGSADGDTPVPSGPRHIGQSVSAENAEDAEDAEMIAVASNNVSEPSNR